MNLVSSLWYLGRGTGLVALVMFTLTMVLGITTRSGRQALGLSRFGVADLHKTAALTGTGLVAAHVGTLLFDPYAQLRLADLVLPFLAAYRPMWLGLGTLAADVLVLVVVSSLLRHQIGPRAFKTLHWAAYALWPFAFLHALGTGTDAGTVWFRVTAFGCALAVGAAVGWRTSQSFAERGFPRIPRRQPRKAVPR